MNLVFFIILFILLSCLKIVIFAFKNYDKSDDFDFEIVNFHFYMVMFLALHPMESIYLNSFVLIEHLLFN